MEMLKKLSVRRKRRSSASDRKRAAREDENQTIPLLQLPAELRNQIYEYLIPTHGEFQQTGRPFGLPPLLHVCRQTRTDIIPLYFANNLLTVNLERLTLHSKSSYYKSELITVLSADAIASVRSLKIQSSSSCFHSDGFATLADVAVLIDREHHKTASVLGDRSALTKRCCHKVQEVYLRLLAKEVTRAGLGLEKHTLTTDDFLRLADKMGKHRTEVSKELYPTGLEKEVR